MNFRGYPHRTTIPTCESTATENGKTVRTPIPCFADPGVKKQIGGITVTPYTANQGIDEWHVLYLWRHAGTLYTASRARRRALLVLEGRREPRSRRAQSRAARARGLTCD